MSTITITRKVKLEPTKDQDILLQKSCQKYVDACNFIAQWIFDNKTLTMKEINKAIYYQVRRDYNLPSQMAQSAMRNVISSYRTIHAANKKWSIKPTFRRSKMDYVWNKDYSINKTTGDFSINTIDGRIKISTCWNGNEKFSSQEKYGTATVQYKRGKWILHLPVDIEVEDVSLDDISNIVGVDMGINFLATSYDSKGKTTFYKGREIKDRRAQYKRLRAELQSKNTRSAKKRLASIGTRENRWINDVNHCIAKALVNDAGKNSLIVLEDLTGIRSATERFCKKDRYVSASWAFYDLRQKIEYKARLNECLTVAVNPAYTSQKCPKCGYTSKKNRNKKKHVFCCKKCSYTSNDDRIAAMNLHSMGIQYRMQCCEDISSQ